jgi:hypothetical protein
VTSAQLAEQVGLLGSAYDVDQLDAVREADPVQHLPEVGRGGGVDQRGVALPAHRLDHPQRRERVDEGRGAIGGGRAVRQREAALGRGQHMLGVGPLTREPDPSAEQGPRLGSVTRSHHDAGALVADRHRPAHPGLEAGHHRVGDRGGDNRAVGCVRDLRGARVRQRQQERQVGGVDRSGLDPDHDLVRLRQRGVDRVHGHADLTVLGDEGAQLTGDGRDVAHASILSAG